MSIRNEISKLSYKPCCWYLRVTGALFLEFCKDKEIRAYARAFKNPKILDALKLVCDGSYSPALTPNEFQKNQQLGQEWIKVVEHQYRRERSINEHA